MPGSERRKSQIILWAVVFLFVSVMAAPVARAETQDLAGTVVDEQNAPIQGAVCTLTSHLLPPKGLQVTTGEKGEFDFPGLLYGKYDLTCAALSYEPISQHDIEISSVRPPKMEVVLPKEIVVKEKVEVKAQASKVTQEQAAPPAKLSAPQLADLPLIEQKFKAALPLVPGVVRSPNGKINIKGAVENQGLLLVNSAEMVDPVTGSYSIEIPIDAVESVQVFKSAYQAEYGRFSGGLTTIDTKAPSDQFRFEVNDFLPTVRVKSGHIVGIADDQPRLYVTGPLVKNKLNFAEAFAYDLVKQPVRGLAYPHNEIKTQGFNSFTSFQYIISPQQLMSTHLDFFPVRRQFANINSLLPQPASSDYGQEGFSAGTTHRYLSSSGAILTSLFQFTRFDSNAHGQGPLDMIITPTGFSGNYFNSWNRNSTEAQAAETYQFAPKHWLGRHELQTGASFLRRSYTGTSISHPVQLLRQDGTLAEQIDFANGGPLTATDHETAVFIQDHWVFDEHLALDAGLRFSTQNIGEPTAFAPRFGLVYSPGSGGKTIFRGGIGVFYDRVPLLAGDFTSNPTRTISLFDQTGALVAGPTTLRNAYVRTDENGNRVVPSGNSLDSTPYNITWNAEADRELLPHLLLRVSYLSSRTLNEFVIDPRTLQTSGPTLLLSNTGGSRYHEFETTVRFRPRERMDLNFSYVSSRARGDLNTLTTIYVPFENPIIRPNAFGTLPSNVSNRFITWGRLKLPWKMTASPFLDIHTGFPYSAVNELQNYVGAPNSLRLPRFASLDLKLTKDMRVPIIPWLSGRQLRLGFTVFNLTDHANPRDVINSVAAPNFGQFLGFQHRFYDLSFDILY